MGAEATEAADQAACLRVLERGSHSFALAGRLLPRRYLSAAAAIYAFCREADDAIDEAKSQAEAMQRHGELVRRLERLAGDETPESFASPTDRALKRALVAFALPTKPLIFLLEGMLWDAEGRRYHRLQDTLAYAARVAGSIGVLLAQLCGQRDPRVLARAADMGTAMQLTNIVRDVGEDARRGRIYLPGNWLVRGGLLPATFLATVRPHPAIATASARLLRLAALGYRRARLGLFALPLGARLGMAAAGRIYEDIGRHIDVAGGSNVTGRAYVGRGRKAWLALTALLLDGHRPRSRRAQAGFARPALCANRPLLAAEAAARQARVG